MLPEGIWREYEPRFGFPVFKEAACRVSLAIPPDFNPRSYAKYKSVGKALIKQKMPAPGAFLAEQLSLWLSRNGKSVRFHLIITTRDGGYLGRHDVPGSFPPGGAVEVDLDAVLAEMGQPKDDYLAIIVMSHGRMDGFRSSPSSFSMTYVGERHYATYRTGAFARTLNDPRRKGHVGFRGIDPKIVATDEAMSGIMLINHSSNPTYDTAVRPSALLLRADGETREAVFGQIPAFGALERSVADLFGDDVREFLAPFGGNGTTIITNKGTTLASLHLMRDGTGKLMAIEHSRPTHTYLFGIS